MSPPIGQRRERGVELGGILALAQRGAVLRAARVRPAVAEAGPG
jgi:hypothetical protein